MLLSRSHIDVAVLLAPLRLTTLRFLGEHDRARLTPCLLGKLLPKLLRPPVARDLRLLLSFENQLAFVWHKAALFLLGEVLAGGRGNLWRKAFVVEDSDVTNLLDHGRVCPDLQSVRLRLVVRALDDPQFVQLRLRSLSAETVAAERLLLKLRWQRLVVRLSLRVILLFLSLL